MKRLRRSDCARPGITRRRRGKGWSYVDAAGDAVTDPEVRDRVQSLAIPPAWADVWICPDPLGHLQAVGTDAAGRRQYRYHDRWRERRDTEKFDHMLDFARELPRLRECCAACLAPADGLARDTVLAAAVRLLDLGFFRVGGEEYTKAHGSFGLTTIRRDHVRIDGDTVVFDYVGKSGVQRVQAVADPAVVAIVQRLRRRRSGPEDLLAWKDGRRWRDVKADDVNDFLQGCVGEDYSAKDFRTWNATVLAAVAVAVSGEARSDTARKRAVTRAVTEVAHYLGNTPAVARSSYIDPRVFDRYRSRWTIQPVLDRLGEDATSGSPSIQGVVEDAVVDLLTDRSTALVDRTA